VLELITMMKLGVGRTLDLGYYGIGFQTGQGNHYSLRRNGSAPHNSLHV